MRQHRVAGPRRRATRCCCGPADSGVAAIEYLGLVGFLILAALAGWQLLLAAAVTNAAENAARAGSRAAGMGDAAEPAALDAMDSWLRPIAAVERGPNPACDDDQPDGGTKVVVCIKVPVFLPALTVDSLEVRRFAWLPRTPT